MRTLVCEFEMYLYARSMYDEIYYYYTKIPGARYRVTGTYSYKYFFFFLPVAPAADRPTRTLTVTQTLWGDLCLDAVACEGSRLIRPKGDAVDEGCVFHKRLKNVSCEYDRLND